MKENLNLLPQNLQVSKGLTSALNTIRSLGVISIVAFTIFCLGLGAFFIYSKIDLGNIETNITYAKSQIKAQEGSEQKLILLKDRIAKIAYVRGTSNASKNINNLDSLFSSLSEGSMITQANVSSLKILASVSIRSHEDLTNFIKNLKDSNVFSAVTVAALDYSSNTGYSVTVDLAGK